MKRALVIGINYATNPKIELNGCIDDAINIKNMLIDAYGYDSKNIVFLRDDLQDSALLPTRKNIFDNLLNIITMSNTTDEITLHYSGHGTRIENIEDKKLAISIEKYDDVLVPVDYIKNGYIVDSDLFELLERVKCPFFFIADCCHSGSILDLKWCFEYKDKCTISRTSIMPRELDNKNIYSISGCTDSQSCSDVYDAENKQYQGAFTNAVITCLRRNQHNVGILYLFMDVYDYLKEGGHEQTPVLSSSKKTPDFHFMRTSPQINVKNPKYYNCDDIQIIDA
jgi:hypothetical protein